MFLCNIGIILFFIYCYFEGVVCVYKVIVLFLIIKVYNFEVIYFVYKIVKYDR